MKGLIKIQGTRTLNEKINDRGNIEQHHGIGGYVGWSGNKRARRKGCVVNRPSIGISNYFVPFY